MTYSTLIETVKQRAFPEGIARNLRDLYSARVLDGLIELQRAVPYLQGRNYSLFPFSGTLYRQGMTVIQKPNGRVRRVCTFSSKTLKDVVYCDYATLEDVERLTASRARSQTYPDAVLTESVGYFNSDSATNKGYRAERVLFCIDEKEIILVPHIESTERILVEWKGIKTDYEDDDVVDFGKYEAQVISCLENWLRSKTMAKDDRSTSDYGMMLREWRESVAGLMLDVKEETEADIPRSDIGQLLRPIMPDTEAVFSLGCAYNPVNAFFKSLWVMCLDNSKYYNLGALLLDGQVVEMISGSGVGSGRAEATYETIRCAAMNLLGSDENYYKLVPHVVDGNVTHGFDGGAVDIAGATSCSNIAVINVDILAPEDSAYYRLNLVLQDGVPVVQIDEAPAELDEEVPAPELCESGNVFALKDVVTQKCMYLRIKDGQISIADS